MQVLATVLTDRTYRYVSLPSVPPPTHLAWQSERRDIYDKHIKHLIDVGRIPDMRSRKTDDVLE